jgi:hypothetical protein
MFRRPSMPKLKLLRSLTRHDKVVFFFFFYLHRLGSLACSHSELIMKL